MIKACEHWATFTGCTTIVSAHRNVATFTEILKCLCECIEHKAGDKQEAVNSPHTRSVDCERRISLTLCFAIFERGHALKLYMDKALGHLHIHLQELLGMTLPEDSFCADGRAKGCLELCNYWVSRVLVTYVLQHSATPLLCAWMFPLRAEYPGAKKSYYRITLKLGELSVVCRLHGQVLDFIHLWQQDRNTWTSLTQCCAPPHSVTCTEPLQGQRPRQSCWFCCDWTAWAAITCWRCFSRPNRVT